MSEAKKKVTIIYCCDGDLAMYRKTQFIDLNVCGEMIIPKDFKQGKTIVAVCDGDINILNSIGDKITPPY